MVTREVVTKRGFLNNDDLVGEDHSCGWRRVTEWGRYGLLARIAVNPSGPGPCKECFAWQREAKKGSKKS